MSIVEFDQTQVALEEAILAEIAAGTKDGEELIEKVSFNLGVYKQDVRYAMMAMEKIPD